jgi:hypothetical protein
MKLHALVRNLLICGLFVLLNKLPAFGNDQEIKLSEEDRQNLVLELEKMKQSLKAMLPSPEEENRFRQQYEEMIDAGDNLKNKASDLQKELLNACKADPQCLKEMENDPSFNKD